MPRFQAVARFADALRLLQSDGHQSGKFSVVRILVAGFAGAIGEVVFPVGARRRVIFAVAILTGDGRVRPFQGKRRGLVLFQGECRGVESFHLVAVFAPVKVRGARKLLRVRVFMTIGARLKRRVIVGIKTGGNMALGTVQGPMLACERVLGRLMAGDGERCGFPARIGMAGATFTVICAGHKLPLVLVFVAVHALFVFDRLLEIGLHMALVAGQALVFAVQREFGLAVVEIAAGNVDPFPRLSVVTRLAPRLERTMMRILMAGAA